MSDPDSRIAIAHLLRRTGFGPTAGEVDLAAGAGYAATVSKLLDFTGPDKADATPLPTFAAYEALGAKNLTADQRKAIEKNRTADTAALIGWWLGRMAATSHPLREKLTWFWHGHFATSIQKVRRPAYMARQNQLLRFAGATNFEVLVQAVAKDPAMLIWLDAETNVKAHANENFARELMELFTLGIGNYTEDDVKQAARAFTGWRFAPTTDSFSVNVRQHDDGVKTVLGQTGAWSGEEVIHILTNHSASAPFIAARLWSHFAYPVGPSDPVVQQLAPPFASSHDIVALLRSMLLHPQFVSDQALTGLVKQPVEWALGTFRALGIPTTDKRLMPALKELSQLPFTPPNVGGWPQNGYWLSTASSLSRLRVATNVVNGTGGAGGADLSAISSMAADQRIDAVAHMLSVSSWSDNSQTALGEVVANPRALVALALVSPEYTLA